MASRSLATEQVVGRVRRVFSLDDSVFPEIRDDAAFTPIAAVLAIGAILIAGIGAWLWAFVVDVEDKGEFFFKAVILGSIFLALLWLAGIAVMYFILTQIYKIAVAPDALFRISAVATLPLGLGLLVFIPGIGFGFGLLSIALVFFFTFYGLRGGFPQIDSSRILLLAIAGFAVWAMILPLLSSSGDPFAPGVFVFEWSEDVVENLADAFSAARGAFQ